MEQHDYQGNAKKNKEESKPEKKIERVTSGEVLVQKKSIGKKFKDLFIEADLKSVGHYLFADVLLPQVRNLIVDASTQGIKRMIYGESAMRRQNMGPGGSRFTYTPYHSQVNRGMGGSPLRNAPPVNPGPRAARANREDFILSSREEAENVLEHMIDIIDTYEMVSVGDLYNLVGWPTSYVDEKWGWTILHNVPIQQVREGYLVDFPPAEPLA